VRILLVEDEARIASFVRRGLVAEGYDVVVATDGRDGMRAALAGDADLVLLDLMLPDVSGEQILRRLREERPELPIIVLTAKDAISDRVSNLEAGAEDYLVKPFSFAELLARIRIRLRDTEPSRPRELRHGPLRLDLRGGEATLDGRQVELSPKEASVLGELMRQAGDTVPTQLLADQVWGQEAAADDAVEIYAASLSTKLGDGIIERRVGGYRLTV
jgi:DNA-binding response OmpR family regulator